jgi:hypothetical protein
MSTGNWHPPILYNAKKYQQLIFQFGTSAFLYLGKHFQVKIFTQWYYKWFRMLCLSKVIYSYGVDPLKGHWHEKSVLNKQIVECIVTLCPFKS